MDDNVRVIIIPPLDKTFEGLQERLEKVVKELPYVKMPPMVRRNCNILINGIRRSSEYLEEVEETIKFCKQQETGATEPSAPPAPAESVWEDVHRVVDEARHVHRPGMK